MNLIGRAEALLGFISSLDIELMVIVRRCILRQTFPGSCVPATPHLSFIHVEAVLTSMQVVLGILMLLQPLLNLSNTNLLFMTNMMRRCLLADHIFRYRWPRLLLEGL